MQENTFRSVNRIKLEYAVKQKKGLPFIMASLVLWTIMLIVFLTDLDISYKNAIALGCSVLLMPLGMLFAKILKIKIFAKESPISALSTIAALNQVLYLPIVIFIMYTIPDKMIMTYAMVVGAHFLTYYWIYFSPTYFYASIIIPVTSLILGIYCTTVAVCIAFIAFDVLICALLYLENKQASKLLLSISSNEAEDANTDNDAK